MKMGTLAHAKERRRVWVKRLEYLERELRRIPKAIESCKGYIAHWDARIVEYDEKPNDLITPSSNGD